MRNNPMRLSTQATNTIDYRQAQAADPFVPNPAVLASSGWDSLHLELHQQPQFEIAEHQHTMHVIACGLTNIDDRSGDRWLDGKRQTERRRSGDIAIIPAGSSHRCNWNTDVQFGILAIEPALLQQVGQDWVNPDRIELKPQFMNEQDPLIQGIFATLRSEIQIGGIGGYLLIDSLKMALAAHLLRNYCTTSPRIISPTGLSSVQLGIITNYIKSNLQLDLTLVELSAIVQLSPYHFSRLFKKSLGMTPHQYIVQQRIDRAKYLLQFNDARISEIAVQVGFCDQSHLTRGFKQILGITPKQFRARIF
jgi:AraC family transcriptional regulator